MTWIFFKIFESLEIFNIVNIIENLEIFILLDKRIIEKMSQKMLMEKRLN